ncbi:MAG: tetratricopeptide repeat protein [Anaerolineae bacterium]|nr:tetratricopeptide repeat protein [Anaerolineae bacterium]
MNRRFMLSCALFALAFSLLMPLPASAQDATAEPAPSAAQDTTDTFLLQRAEDALAAADRTLNAINLTLGVIQVLGVILVVLGGLAAFAGFQRNREERNRLQNELQNARDTNAKIGEVFDEKLKKMDDANRQLTDDFNVRMDEARKALGEVQKTREKLEKLDGDSAKILSDIQRIESGIEKQRDVFTTEINAALEKVRQGAEALVLSQFAQRQINLGNLRPAVEYLEKACELDPQNTILQYFLGDLLVRQGKLTEGIACLQRARASRDPSADASYAYAIRQQGDKISDPIQRERMYSEASDIFLSVYASDPFLIDISGESVFGALAGLYRRQGRLDKAIEWYEHTRRVSPQNSYPVNNLAVLYFRQGSKAEADKYFRRAKELAEEKLAVRSSDYWARFDLMTAKIALGDSFESIKPHLDMVFEQVSSTDPLRKFLGGLQDLSRATQPPKAITSVINTVETEIAQRGDKNNS